MNGEGEKNSSAKKSKQGSELLGGGWGAERQANDFQGKPHKHAATGVHTHTAQLLLCCLAPSKN